MFRIGEDIYLLVHELCAELVTAARLGKKTATFISAARLEITNHPSHQIAYGGRFEDNRVFAWVQRRGIDGLEAPRDRALTHRSRIELAEIVRILARPA